jgi:DNA-binding transcriptional LysR family regulator
LRRSSACAFSAGYLEVGRRILSELDGAEAALQEEVRTPSGPLTVTAPVVFGKRHVMPLIREFVDRHPAVQARVLLLDRIVDLVEEGVDVAVRIGHLRDSALIASQVGRVRRILCASPAYLASAGTPRRPLDLGSHRFVAAALSGALALPALPRRGRHAQATATPALAVNSVEAAIDAALAGFGITAVLSYQVDEELRAGALVRACCESMRPRLCRCTLSVPQALTCPSRCGSSRPSQQSASPA